MKRQVAVTILLLGSLIILPISTRPGHAQFTGLVCLTLPTINKCPQIPFTFSNTAVGSSFTIGIYINNSDAMGGFDIYVKSDPSFVNPTSAALGPLIASPSLTSICVNGSPQTGTCTVGTANGPGVVEVTTIESSGINECGGISPCSGLAFTITYHVVASVTSTTFSWPTAAGCSTSSISSPPNPPNTCVEVADATGTVLPEKIQTPAGYFDDLTPSANFVTTPTSGLAPLKVNFDATLSNATSGNTITSYNWAFGDGITANLTSPTTSHTYATGTYVPNLEIVDSSAKKSTIKNGPTINVGQPDFSINGNTTSLFFLPGKNRNATIILTSLLGFAGTVALTSNSSTSLGIKSSLNHASVTLAPGQTDSSTKLTVNATTTTPIGSYVINVTGASGVLKHSFFITVNVVRLFYTISSSGSITTIRGFSGKNNITLTLTDGTAQAITPSCLGLPTGALCSFSKANVTPTTSGNTTTLTITTTTSTPSGVFSITIAGNIQHATNATFSLAVSDFQISANPASLSIPQSGNGASLVSFNSQQGFSGNIALDKKTSSNNVVAFLNRTSISLTVGGSNSSSLYIIVLSGTNPGTYTVTVSGTIGPLIHKFNVTVVVPVPSFGAGATPTSVSVKTGANGTSAITLIALNGFNGTINLRASAPPSLGISTAFSSTALVVNTGTGPVASTLTIATSSTTSSGTYTITVNATTATLYRLVNITLTVISPLPSLQIGAAVLSTVSTTAGNSVAMTVTASNTGTIPVNITVTMDVNSGRGNITVAQRTVTLNPGLASQTITLSWNTTQWSAGNYHVYARVIGSQTNAVNQAQSAGTVSLSSPPAPPPSGVNLGIIPWVTTGILAVIAAIFAVLLFRRRRPKGTKEPL